ncbi:asparagine synthase (glutamine-hydrolyzing) [Tautonia plasticadhaerens]|uniref:asparagine synthase (glutamine-hydrolyzing) n=1 Tax=Tautonia plasticadhaerens TaxID=2527974 RepID=A0A518GWA7_9BACT|nr:asparagine synthase (glutamine-hydrolyzing) [Tautonia plasticadhaerens]QDV32859.1 Asparagine synthetase [glutamine-hydrolyzing] 1 [Tautonia plasticadhaerens]
MCGIAGFINPDGEAADRSLLARMTGPIAHRGPDGEGAFVDGPVGLGHRLLAIIDPGSGAQPMGNEDGTVWVSYNGEIYNERDLRSGLESRGHRYRTRCDTESLVHLYEEEGPEFVRRLNGMFALALWDSRRRVLVLARDRMGQKPLFYAVTPRGGLVFGSEPKALLAHPDVPRRLDPAGLARYLFYEYVPAPGSIWGGMAKLPAGHLLQWSVDRGEADVRRYWEPPTPLPDAEAPPFPEAAARFWGLFRESVARHRRSDVPLGVFLSGGIDSSSVAAALAELEPPGSIRTFSIGFDDPTFDESGHARAVARHLGTDHRERTFAVSDVPELLPGVVDWLDEPFGDASILPTHLLSRFARSEVTVCLGGDGSDELLAGYPTFAAERAARLFRSLPGPARAMVGAAVGRLPVNHGNISLDFKLKQFVRGASEPGPLAHQRWIGSFSGPELAGLLAEPPPIDVEAEHLARASAIGPGLDGLSRSLRLYQDTYLPEDILTKVDRASMATSLEVRAPFLDAGLVDFVAMMPSRYKYARGTGKRLLRAAAADRLPASILGRPKKGFGIPVARWLRGPLSGLLGRLLEPDRLRSQGLLRPDAVSRLVAEHRGGVRDHRKPLWTLLILQLWLDRWLREP